MARYLAYLDAGDARRLAERAIHLGGPLPPPVQLGNGWVDLTRRVTAMALGGQHPLSALPTLTPQVMRVDASIGLDAHQTVCVVLDGRAYPLRVYADQPADTDDRLATPPKKRTTPAA